MHKEKNNNNRSIVAKVEILSIEMSPTRTRGIRKEHTTDNS